MSVDAEEDGLDEVLLRNLFSYIEAEGNEVPSSSTSGVLGVSGEQERGPGPQRQTLPLQQTRTSGKAAQASSGVGGRIKRQRDADKVKELEAIAAGKMEQFAALLQRNNELKFKSKILSDAVLLRDFQLRIVKDGGWYPTPWPIPSLPGAGAAVPDGATDATLAQLQLMRSTAQAVHVPGSVTLLFTPEVMAALPNVDVSSMGRLQMTARWKAFLSEASTLLLALEVNPGDEAAACRMKQSAAEATGLCRHMSLLAPNTMLGVLQTHLETNELASPEPGFWTQVLQTLKLTDEQLREIRAVYELFSGIMRRVLAERRAIQAQLSTGLEAADQRLLVAPQQVPPEAEVLPALERNMRKEGAAHLLVRAFVLGRTLSIMQLCRAAVHSYPYFANTTGLAAAAAGVSV